MTVQKWRRHNLTQILAALKSSGIPGIEQQILALGGGVSPGRLRRMVGGYKVIPPLLARAVEHALHLPRGALDVPDATLTIAERAMAEARQRATPPMQAPNARPRRSRASRTGSPAHLGMEPAGDE